MPLILDSPAESVADSPSDLREVRRREHHEADVVIVGAGILGSALAVTLANQGRSVILLEKSLKEPDRIVGELLQPGGVEALEKLGLRHTLDDIDAVPVKGYTVIYHGEPVTIPYPAKGVQEAYSKVTDAIGAPAPAPQGRSFHHGRFVANLRAAALAHANITVFETEVTSIVRSSHSVQVLGVESLSRKSQKDYFFGSLTVICDGYASKFRKSVTHLHPSAKSRFWGLELIDCPLPIAQYGTVVLGDNAPVLLYQIGTHETRVLVDIPEGLASASTTNGGVKGHLQNVVLPSLPPMVQASFQAALDRGQLRSMPNSFLPSSANKVPGLVLLGDALNMRHPLTGGGMTVALTDVALLGELLAPDTVPDLIDTTLVLRQLRRFHWRRKHLTSIINVLAQALYALFAADDWRLRQLQLGCFRYFQRGGSCVDEPAGLLAGLTSRPFVLFYHFFSVALFSIWLLIRANGVLLLPLSIVQGVLVFWRACQVIFPYIFAELRP